MVQLEKHFPYYHMGIHCYCHEGNNVITFCSVVDNAKCIVVMRVVCVADGGVLNITAAVWTVGFHWWRSGNKKRTQNVGEYMLVLAVCLVVPVFILVNL